MNLPAPHEWSPPPPSPSAGAPGPVLASYGRRILAWVVDVLIFAVPFALVLAATVDFDTADPVASVPAGVPFAFALAFIGYQAVMIAWRGQTVGAISMSIRVVRVDTHAIPGWPPSAIRALVSGVAGLVPVAGILVSAVIHVWMFFDPHRQGLQDKAAGTIVVTTTV